MSESNKQLRSSIESMFTALKNRLDGLFSRTETHIGQNDNPHSVTKSQVGLSELPNGVTSDRTVNSIGQLLTAKGMYDHTLSGDHDSRYYTQTQLDQALGLKIDIATIVNDLTSNTVDAPLSAAQGKILKDAVDAINTLVNSDDGTLDEIQEIVDFIKVNRDTLENLTIASIAGLGSALSDKVDKVTGKGLSENDFTDELLDKLISIATGAEVNVDTNLTATPSDLIYTILNDNGSGFALQPATSALVGLMSPTDKIKLNGVQSGAQVNPATTAARNDASSTTVLQAAAMNNHAASSDHDDRYYTKGQTATSLETKVDKVTGKGLSTEDYSSAERTKLTGIASGAQVNVPTNLSIAGSGDSRSISSSTGNSALLPVASSASAGLLSRVDKNKLDTVQANAEPNVATNLDRSLAVSSLTITNSNGTNAVLPGATTNTAGVLSAPDKVKLNDIEIGAQVNVSTDLSLIGNGDTRTLVSSTGTNVFLPLATATTAGLMGVNDKSKLDNVGAGAEANPTTTDARDSVSTTTLLQAKAMNDHVDSADHDGRYYQKAKIDSELIAVENRSANYMETRVAVEVDQVINYNPALVLDAASVESQKGTGESFETVLDQWYRFSHSTTGVYPADASETTSWTYNSATDQIEATINSATVIGFVSPDRYEDYNFEVVVNSSGADDDEIGIVLAFAEIDGVEYMLTAGRNTGGIGPQRFNVVYNYGQVDSIDLGSNSNGGIGQIGMWSEFTAGARIRAERRGNLITVKTTPLDSDVYDEAATVVIDLNNLPQLSKFKGPSSYGYMCRSQPSSTWSTLAKPTAIDEVVDVTNRLRWNYDGTVWSSRPIPVDEDLAAPKRLYFNQSLKSLLLSTDDGLRQIPIVDPSDGVLRHKGGLEITGDVTFDDQSKAVRSSDILRIVKVTQANYPASPDPETLYVVVE